VIRQQFFYEWNQFCEPACRGKQHVFFRRKMNLDLTLKNLRNFSLPRRYVGLLNRRCALNPHAQRQCMLVLVR
jgi:hypothetical protein